MGDDADYDRGDGDDYYSNDGYDDHGDGDNSGGMQSGPPPFRGRGGGGPWRSPGGGRGGRGHFNDGNFGNRGGGPRFRGRGGFMGPSRGGGGGHGDRGRGSGFMNRGGFRGRGPGNNDFGNSGNGGNWNNGPPSHHGGMGGPPSGGGMFNSSSSSNSGDTVWAEARSPDGKIYYYHTVTRETTWDRPEGPGIRIVRHDEWSTNKSPQDGGNFGGSKNEGHHHDQSPSMNFQNQNSSHGSMMRQGFSGGGSQSPGFNMPPPGMGQGGPGSSGMQGPPPNMQRSDTTPAAGLRAPSDASPESEMKSGSNFMGVGQSSNSQQRPPDNRFPGSMSDNDKSTTGNTGTSDDKTGNRMEIPTTAESMNIPQIPMTAPPGVGGMPMPVPMMPPFGPFGAGAPPPPFGMPPPAFPPRAFAAMVPPPWGIPPGVPPPTGVPPPGLQLEQLAISQVDPKIVAKAFEWTEHASPTGKTYYFCAKTQTSVWEKPTALLEFEAAKLAIQQRLTSAPPMMMVVPSKDKTLSEKSDSSDIPKAKEIKREKKLGPGEKCRPISSTPVSGTPWCVVWTGDKRVFFYNPSNKTSVWEKPQELIGRYDVEELLRAPPDASKAQGKVKKAEATSTTSPQSHEIEKSGEAPGTQEALGNAPKGDDLKERTSKCEGDESFEKEPPTKRTKREQPPESAEIDDNDDKDDDCVLLEDEISKSTSAKKEKVKIETKDGFKEINALEAEVKAARERAIVPIDVRLQKFREMLIEKQVSAFSTWEKELHKIVFDPRYLYLTSKERKQAFETYVKERAEEERKEKKKMFKQVKEHFITFLESCNISSKMTYNEFSQKYSRDERFRNVEKTREREQYFNEYVTLLKKRDKEERALRKDKAREEFVELLKERVKDYHMKWSDVKKKIDSDYRFDGVDGEERESLYKGFQKKLKSEIKSKEKKKKRERKERERERKARDKKERRRSENVLGLDTIDSNEEDMDGDDKNEPGLIQDADDEEKSSENRNDDISEEEEGCITDDSDDDMRLERERKERAEVSIREREREVQRTLATHLRDRDKEREFYQHEEAVQEFQALLTDLVRNADVTWKEVKRLIRKDRRWDAVSVLSREEMEELFNQHEESISKKKKMKFRELLEESRVKLSSTWKEVRKRIKEDPRYSKFSSSDRKCEREFELYIKDMSAAMKGEFRNLLKETKMLTYKTKQQLRDSPHILKDIESLLEKDKRYLQLEEMSDERHRLILEYLDDLERKGPPPPPTASEPSRRLKTA